MTAESARQVDTADNHASEIPRRTCGRCRESFAGDPTLEPSTRPAFWLCRTCRAVLLPGR